MATTGGSLWDKIGKVVAEAVEVAERTGITVLEALKLAGINFTAVKKPLWGGDLDGIIKKVPGKAAIVKEGDGEILGVTSDRYGIVQNAEGFAFADYIEGLQFVRGGITYTGMNYLIGKLPAVNILGDTFTPYLVFQNSFNGLFQLKAAIVPLRDDTDTQYRIGLGGAKGQVRIRHSKNAKDRLEAAHEAMLTVHEFMDNLRAMAEEFSEIKVDADTAVNKLFPISEKMTERQEINVREQRERFKLHLKDPHNEKFAGTAWGVFNAYADYLTHSTLKDGVSIKKVEKAFERSLDPKKLTKAADILRKL